MIWYIILSLFIIFLVWILLGPVILYINTNRNAYHVTLPGIISVSLVPNDVLFRIRGWILFIPFRFDPFREGKHKSRKKERTAGKKKNAFRWFRKRGQFSRIPRAVRIKRLDLDIDTDDAVMNAWLVPVFSAVNEHSNLDLRINFEGNLFLHLDMRTRIGTILWILLTKR